ncbi:signal peptidase I [Nocardioides sp. Y6]|uniref:Signal peptidase I n=1 Tax=Nocardioides malaquae TaxID=2773426 RepID=A0ABR9RWP1_9ACTN|nr:Ig-like domain-containing protein [Nocardioides malaquae]MBE7326005.1 signal peptidase I [Nocardioides malaquae]
MTTTARNVSVLAVALLLAVLAVHGPRSSSAIFTSSSQAVSSVTAAADWTPPTVTVTDPGPSVSGTVTVRTTPTDADSGIARVVVEGRPTGASAWQQVCTVTAAPWTCSLDTAGLTDGEYALRARAVDKAGNEATSAVVRTTVANRASIVLTAPSSTVRGTVALAADVREVGALPHTVRIERAPVGGAFTTLCDSLSSPYACSWDTTTVTPGAHQLRAVVLDAAGRAVATSATVTVTTDNVAPSVALTDPSSPLKGVRPFAVTASDAHSGVARVVVQGTPVGAAAWRDLCTATQSPWGCSVDTTALADGQWSFRAMATDLAGNSTTSAVVGPRLIENVAPTVTVDVRTGSLSGTVPVSATATSGVGITSVRLQVAPAGSSTWTDLCTRTAAPWSCVWNTTRVANGQWSLRAVMVDGLGRTTTSTVVTRSVAVTFLGADVQSANGGDTVGRSETGDSFTYTFSHEVNPASILAGWNGQPRAVIARVRDTGSSYFSGSDEDVFDVVTTNEAPINLGVVNLKEDYILAGRSAQFDSTMTATTVAGPDGTPRTVVTISFGSLRAWHLTAPKTVSSSSTMVWTPSALVTDTVGRPLSTAPVLETGPLDREF